MPGRVGCLAASGSPSFERRRATMRSEKMHSDELDIDAALVARLIAAQFPQWADLPIVKAPSAGTDHAIYRLADDMVVRLPRIPGAARQVDKEQRWLPHLAPQLPLQVPVPLGRGAAVPPDSPFRSGLPDDPPRPVRQSQPESPRDFPGPRQVSGRAVHRHWRSSRPAAA